VEGGGEGADFFILAADIELANEHSFKHSYYSYSTGGGLTI
jgi:hypothetical protein